jgi:hypothetical protein
MVLPTVVQKLIENHRFRAAMMDATTIASKGMMKIK